MGTPDLPHTRRGDAPPDRSEGRPLPEGTLGTRDIASVLNMLRKAAERLGPRYAEAVKTALSAVDEKALEEWTAEVLEAEGPDVSARASPTTPPGEEAVSPAGGRERL